MDCRRVQPAGKKFKRVPEKQTIYVVKATRRERIAPNGPLIPLSGSIRKSPALNVTTLSFQGAKGAETARLYHRPLTLSLAGHAFGPASQVPAKASTGPGRKPSTALLSVKGKPPKGGRLGDT